MEAATTERADLVSLPTTADLEAFTAYDRWQLEATLEEVQPRLREINDAELRQWVEIDGKTQTEIAEIVGLSVSRINQRVIRLGIEISKGKGTAGGRPRAEVSTAGNPTDPEPELVEGEVVNDRRKPRRLNGKEGPAHYLPDVVAPDADENLRTQALHWFEQGAHIKGLLDRRRPLEPRSPEDRKAIKREAAAMERVARRLKEACA